MMNKKGFTLIEVLVVVVIIAILAALILPRFMDQSERAYIAEAQQVLGVMCRGAIRYMDLRATSVGPTVSWCGWSMAAATCNATEWSSIGMKPPSSESAFRFSCQGDYCVARRYDGPNYPAEIPRIILYHSGAQAGKYVCDQGYTYADASDHTLGCTY